jgi:hypothetical protein
MWNKLFLYNTNFVIIYTQVGKMVSFLYLFSRNLRNKCFTVKKMLLYSVIGVLGLLFL